MAENKAFPEWKTFLSEQKKKTLINSDYQFAEPN